MARLTWSGCTNVRDLGGLPTTDGGRTRDRALVRADSLTRLDEEGIAALDGYGVSRIIDLRAEAETTTPQHPYAGSPSYVNQPWADVPLDGDATLADFYVGSLRHNRERIAAVVRAFVEAPPGAVVVHCAAGKDRTGITSALLLLVAGVPREVVVDDYVLSDDAFDRDALVAGMDHAQRAQVERFARSVPETISAFLDALDDDHGGVTGFLQDACGLSPDELAAARDRLAG